MKYGKDKLTLKTMVSSRSDALKAEHSHYFTGRECKYGHVAPRLTKNARCVECLKENENRKKEGKYLPRLTKPLTEEERIERRKEYKRRYYQENKEHLQMLHKKWLKANREKENARYRERYRKDPEKFIAKSQRYYKANREEILEKRKEWRKKNKAWISMMNREYYLKTKKKKQKEKENKKSST